MKLFSYLALSCFLFTIFSCTKDLCNRTVTYTKATAFYENLATLRLPIESNFNAQVATPSKIFIYGEYLFMSEEDRGIHILDNSDPANPVTINFIPIPGNRDLIVKGSHLLADSYYDLLVIDIENPRQPKLLSRNVEAFPVTMRNAQGEALVGFNYEEVTEKIDCQSSIFENGVFFFDENNSLIAPSSVPTSFSGAKSSNGTAAGSLSRMASVDNYLYIISQSSVYTFEKVGEQIESRDISNIGQNFETIYPLDDKLFIGAQDGMHILDISNRISPQYISQFSHQVACDPVYPTDKVAYVTLRTGNTCEGSVNQLNVVSLQNITRPVVSQQIEMANPHGLTLLGDKLIVCEGRYGIKIFDASDRIDLSLISSNNSFTAYDVIPHPELSGILLIIGDDGLIQLEIDGENNLSELSTIGF